MKTGVFIMNKGGFNLFAALRRNRAAGVVFFLAGFFFFAISAEAVFYSSQTVLAPSAAYSFIGDVFSTSYVVVSNSNGSISRGGAILSDGEENSRSITLNIDGALFSGNKVYNPIDTTDSIGRYLGAGGAVYIRFSNVSISNTRFENNQANRGGALYIAGGIGYNARNAMTMSGNIVFANNSALNGGGALYINDDGAGGGFTINFDNLYFENNAALKQNGGAANFAGASPVLRGKNLVFIGNKALEGRGGALNSSNDISIYADNIIFKDNAVVSSWSVADSELGGGAMELSGTFNIKAYQISFENNFSAKYGGAINAAASVNQFSADNISFIKNTASEKGGALRVYGGNFYLGLSTGTLIFKDNVASTGGAIYVSNATLSLQGKIIFINNSAFIGANDISLHDNSNVRFENGSKVSFGGGVAADYDEGQDVRQRGYIEFGENVEISAVLGVYGDRKDRQDGNSAIGAINANSIGVGSYSSVTYLGVARSFIGDSGAHIFKLLHSSNDDGMNKFEVALKDNVFFHIASEESDKNSFFVSRRSFSDIAERLGISENEAANLISLFIPAPQMISAEADEFSNKKDFSYFQDRIYSGLQSPEISAVYQGAADAANILPSVMPIAQLNALRTFGQIDNLVSLRARDTADMDDFGVSRISIWAQGLFSFENYENRDKMKSQSLAGALGAEVFLNDRAKLGLGFIFDKTDMDIDFIRASQKSSKNLDIDSLTTFIYGEYKPSYLFYGALLGFSSPKYKESKNIAGSDILDNYNSNNIFASLSAGYEGGLIGIPIVPQISLRYIRYGIDAYKDSLQNYNYGFDGNVLSAFLTLSADKYFLISDSLILRPKINAGAGYDIIDDKPKSKTLSANGALIETQFNALPELSFTGNLSFVLEIERKWSASLSYNGVFRDGYNSNGVFLTLQYHIK